MLVLTFVSIKTLKKKSYISAKIEAVKHSHPIFLLASEQRRRPIRLYSREPRDGNNVKTHHRFVFYVIAVAWYHRFVFYVIAVAWYHRFVFYVIAVAWYHRFVFYVIAVAWYHRFVFYVIAVAWLNATILECKLEYVPMVSENTPRI